MASNISDDKKLSTASKTTDEENDVTVKVLADVSSGKSKKHAIVQTKAKKPTKFDNKLYWDPLVSPDWDSAGPPGHFASTRIKRDLSSLFKDPLPGIFAIPDETNLCLVHCLVLGPFETPYEGGFFHFAVRFGPSYPIHPPRVRLLTTGEGKVRFNPNLYSTGKVCLSILGTWAGPVWSPALNLGSLLLSIQSLLNDKPFYNEPGFKTEHYHGESDRYNLYLTHETIRVSVCCQLEDYYYDTHCSNLLPSELAEVMKESFFDLYDDYVEICNKHKHLDGQALTDIFYAVTNRHYNFANLLTRLEKLKEKLSSLPKPSSEKEKDSSLSSISDEEDFLKVEKPITADSIIKGTEKFETASATTIPKYTIYDDIELLADDDDDEDDDEDDDDGGDDEDDEGNDDTSEANENEH